MIDYLTTGQVLPTGSPVHRLDPRTRLLGFVGLLAVLVSAGHPLPANSREKSLIWARSLAEGFSPHPCR